MNRLALRRMVARATAEREDAAETGDAPAIVRPAPDPEPTCACRLRPPATRTYHGTRFCCACGLRNGGKRPPSPPPSDHGTVVIPTASVPFFFRPRNSPLVVKMRKVEGSE